MSSGALLQVTEQFVEYIAITATCSIECANIDERRVCLKKTHNYKQTAFMHRNLYEWNALFSHDILCLSFDQIVVHRILVVFLFRFCSHLHILTFTNSKNVVQRKRKRVRTRAHVLRLTCSLQRNFTFFYLDFYFYAVLFGCLIHTYNVVSRQPTRICEYVLEIKNFMVCLLHVTSGSISLFVVVPPLWIG